MTPERMDELAKQGQEIARDIAQRASPHDVARDRDCSYCDAGSRLLAEEERLALTANVAHLESQLSAEREARQRAETKLSEYRAAFVLLAHEHAFPLMSEQNRERMQAGKGPGLLFVNGTDYVELCVLCSDTFGYACADGETVALEEAPALLALADDEGWPGIIRWIQAKREAAGEHETVIPKRRESMERHDDALSTAIARAERAEAERDAARRDATWADEQRARAEGERIAAEDTAEAAYSALREAAEEAWNAVGETRTAYDLIPGDVRDASNTAKSDAWKAHALAMFNMRNVLASTPSAHATAYRARVIEECADICDYYGADTAVELAARLRSLAGKDGA
jgi:hypothetical protein